MALLFMDGFDAGDFQQKYINSSVTGMASSTATRFSYGRCLTKSPNASGSLFRRFAPSASVVVGFAAKYSTNYSGWQAVFVSIMGDNATTNHIHLGTGDVAGTIEVSRGFYTSRTVLYTVNVPANVWTYFELRVKVADTGGYADLRVNGAPVGTFTGDTKNAGTSTMIDAIQLYGSGNNTGITVSWDDLYVIDETGAAPYNTYLGDVRVQTLVPSAPGASSQMTPSAGENWDSVNELPFSAADYVQAKPSQLDTYQASDLLGGTTAVYGTQVNAVVKKADAGAIAAKTALRTGGSSYFGPTTVVGTGDVVISDLRTQDPTTNADWTINSINNVEIGIGTE